MSEDQKIIASALKELCDETPEKRLEPKRVVDAARDPSHPLHKYFEWDDSVAAEQHREYQARRLIQGVSLYIEYEERTIRAPFYVRDQRVESEEQGYAPIQMFTSGSIATQILEREIARVESALERARGAAIALGVEEKFERATRLVMPRLNRLLKDQRPPRQV